MLDLLLLFMMGNLWVKLSNFIIIWLKENRILQIWSHIHGSFVVIVEGWGCWVMESIIASMVVLLVVTINGVMIIVVHVPKISILCLTRNFACSLFRFACFLDWLRVDRFWLEIDSNWSSSFRSFNLWLFQNRFKFNWMDWLADMSWRFCLFDSLVMSLGNIFFCGDVSRDSMLLRLRRLMVLGSV